MTGVRVDFYVLSQASAAARLNVACRIAEKAYLASQSVLIWHTDRSELEALDERLWTFSDGSFVPHEWLGGWPAPVRLSLEPPPEPVEVLINLAHSSEPPPFFERVTRIAEIIDGEPARREAGRARFKAYRQMGLSPATHELQAN